jgi:hypothetical protein
MMRRARDGAQGPGVSPARRRNEPGTIAPEPLAVMSRARPTEPRRRPGEPAPRKDRRDRRYLTRDTPPRTDPLQARAIQGTNGCAVLTPARRAGRPKDRPGRPQTPRAAPPPERSTGAPAEGRRASAKRPAPDVIARRPVRDRNAPLLGLRFPNSAKAFRRRINY